jgi:hypothetical protein
MNQAKHNQTWPYRLYCPRHYPTKQPPENLGSAPEMSISTAQSYEKLIKQIKNQQEIIASLPKDSHNINPEAVVEQEAEPDTIVVSDNEDQSDADLETLDHRDLPTLHWAKAELEARHKKKNLDLFFQAQVTSMIMLINLFLDLELDYGWMECLKLAAKAAGKELLIMHEIFEDGWMLTCNMDLYCSIDMAVSTPQFLMMKT